jgi:Ca2+-binding EF-hand superfamily protein
MVGRCAAIIAALLVFPAVAAAQEPCTGDARHVVNEIYRQILERSADRGSDTFVRQLTSGQATVREVVRQVAKSSEHKERFLAGDGEDARRQAVGTLYRHLLDRQADAGGVQAHSAGLASKGADAVIDNIVNSSEYQEKFGDNRVPGTDLRYCGPQAQGSARNETMRFQAMDRNRDGVIARTEWQGTRQSFGVHDWNGDGVLSGDEVRAGARRQAQNIDDLDFNPDNAGEFNAWSESGFASIDHNRDGRISEQEWHYDYETFNRVDWNRDGSLSKSEFMAADTEDDRSDRFEYLDMNGDNRITRSEWHGTDAAFNLLDRNNNNVLSRNEVVGNRRAAPDRFANLDVNRDGRLTSDEWHWSRRSFNQQDSNGDGVVTRREFGGGPVPTTGR